MNEKTKDGLRLLCDRCYGPMKRVLASPIGGGYQTGAQCEDPTCGRFFLPEMGYSDIADGQPKNHNSSDPRCPDHQHWMGVSDCQPNSDLLTYICIVDGCEKSIDMAGRRARSHGSGA
jgi:hypothetical protein